MTGGVLTVIATAPDIERLNRFHTSMVVSFLMNAMYQDQDHLRIRYTCHVGDYEKVKRVADKCDVTLEAKPL